MQTPEGAKKAVAKLKAKDPDYFKKIGKLGGKAEHTTPRGFAYMKANGQEAKISAAGSKGGRISRRTKPATVEEKKKGNFNWIFKK